MGLVVEIDGLAQRKNSTGLGAAKALAWLTDTNGNYSEEDLPNVTAFRYFFNASAPIDVTSSETINVIDWMAGVVIADGSPPVEYTLISETAMDALKALGMVLMSRSRELFSRSLTQAEVNQPLAA